MGGQGGCLLTGVAKNNQTVMMWHVITVRQHSSCRVNLTSAHLVGDVALQRCRCVVVCHGRCGWWPWVNMVMGHWWVS